MQSQESPAPVLGKHFGWCLRPGPSLCLPGCLHAPSDHVPVSTLLSIANSESRVLWQKAALFTVFLILTFNSCLPISYQPSGLSESSSDHSDSPAAVSGMLLCSLLWNLAVYAQASARVS